MKDILYNIFIVTFSLLLTVSCTKDHDITIANGEGCLQLRYSLNNSVQATRGGDLIDEVLQVSTLKIYNETGGLLRRYSPATEAPSDIFLISGTYKVTLSAGEKESASFSKKSYYGEKVFTITANQTADVELKCSMINTVVKVVFEPTINTKFDTEYMTYVSASNSFSKTDAENNSVPTLKYTSDSSGYFILPVGIDSLSWGFYGKSTEIGDVTKKGFIAKPKSAYQYTIIFKYSKTPDGFFDIVVKVNEEGTQHDDDFIFALQPTISGSSFDIEEMVLFDQNTIELNIESMNANIKKVEFTANGAIYKPFENTVNDISLEGIVYTKTNEQKGTLSLDVNFFNKFSAGVHDITFSVIDSENVEGNATMRAGVAGIFAEPITDLWNNTAIFQAVTKEKDTGDVKFLYKPTGSNEWNTLTATKGEDHVYSATAIPEWSEGKNGVNGDGQIPVYTPKDNIGIFANNTYDVKIVVGDSELNTMQFSTSTTQFIPDGEMNNSGLSCYTQDNENAASWASGNNTFTGSLCTYSTKTGMEGGGCSKLAADKAPIVGYLASGNMHLGIFKMKGMSGIAQFGQAYTWEARPKAMRVKYHATVGKVNLVEHSGAPIAINAQDLSRIYVAIIDWSARHDVTAGAEAPVGVWDPETMNATAEGKIIAYGSLYIDATTAGSSMIEVVIPIKYYDISTKPINTYTLTVSATTSAYGDYMVGCSDNVMYVDDFEWVY